MFKTIALLVLCLCISGTVLSEVRHYPRGTYQVFITNKSTLRTHLLKNIAPIVTKSITEGYYPGAVILAGHKGEIIYKGVFGNSRILPHPSPMCFDTIFDVASLTKAVATAPAIMQLVEQGKLNLDASVAHYWPAFAKENKQSVTVRELLTHTSGLADTDELNLPEKATTKQILNKIAQLKLKTEPGQSFIYSDVNFIVLAHLVKIVSGKPLDEYAEQNIFKPLGMKNTFFSPNEKLYPRIAPTEVMNKKLRWGKVHDPVAFAMDGVSGHAGLFSNAKDLGIYAQSLLNGGKLPRSFQDGKTKLSHFLGPLAVTKMITPQTPEKMLNARGLGWDIDSVYSTRGVLFPIQSFGHTGWTGTSIWIDPVTETWLVILTSRTHPTPTKHNQIVEDRRVIANIISASITEIKQTSLNNTSQGEINRAYFQ